MTASKSISKLYTALSYANNNNTLYIKDKKYMGMGFRD